MSDMTLFDANCSLGYTGGGLPDRPVDAATLEAALDAAGIAEALVTHASALDYDAAYGNDLLDAEVAGHRRLHRCWVVQPPHTGEMPPPDDLVTALLASGARAARLLPKRVGPLRPFVYGDLLHALEARRVPLLLDFELGHYGSHLTAIDWDGLSWLLDEHRHLPVVLLRAGMAMDRLLLPFMDGHANLHIETSYYTGSNALERLAARAGAERLVFGTGMPACAPGPAITLLTYSALSDGDKRLIASANLRRLLAAAG